MKKIAYIILGLVAVFTVSCEPQYDKAPEIGPRPTVAFTIDNSNPNTLILTAESDNGFMYTWDLGNGEKKQGETVSAYFPFSGEYTITCIASGKGGESSISKTVTIAETDPELAEKPGFKELTGSGKGKIWEYDVPDFPTTDGDPGYCYMTANYDWEEFWWNPYNDDYGTVTPDFGATMKFDLNGGYNYTFIDADGNETKGTFLLDTDNMTLKIIGAPIPDQYEENCDPEVNATGIYQVKILDDDSLFLWQDQSIFNPDDYDYGWAWVFRPKSSL